MGQSNDSNESQQSNASHTSHTSNESKQERIARLLREGLDHYGVGEVSEAILKFVDDIDSKP